jgi:hypothetical protein
MKNIIFLLMLSLLCQCASLEKSAGLGASVGAGAGLITSQALHYNAKGSVVLGLSGAIIGGLLGVLFHKNPSEETKPSNIPSELLKSIPPPLRDAEKDVLWVPDKIEGDRFIENHRIFVIKKPAHWQLRDSEQQEVEEEEK